VSGILARRWQAAAALILLALAAAFPLLVPDALTIQIAFFTVLYVGAVVAWNLFSGYSGYISLGHAVFFGTGAYTAGLIAFHLNMNTSAVFGLLPLAGVAAAVVAVPFGLIALRVRRHTFVVITIAIFFIFQLMAFNLGFTRGNNGVAPPVMSWAGDPATYGNPFYYAALIIAAGSIALSWLVRGSRFGLQLLAIRDDEDRARGLGVRAMRVKLGAFVISAFITGMLGALWILFLGQAYPETAFNPIFDLTVALMAFLGGFGTLWGPVLGALILEPLQQEVTLAVTSGYLGQIILGALFLLVILFLPRGLLTTGGEWVTRWRARRTRGSPDPPPPAAGATGAAPAPDGERAAQETGAAGTGGTR
jgi:branched-chain amino acid transport system permease protein